MRLKRRSMILIIVTSAYVDIVMYGSNWFRIFVIQDSETISLSDQGRITLS